MARLALATIMVIVVVGAVAIFVAGLTSMRRTRGAGEADVREGSAMQKVSFFLLIALILYVSASGGA
jgi:Na+/H+ antiporter NhaC